MICNEGGIDGQFLEYTIRKDQTASKMIIGFIKTNINAIS